MDLTTIPVLPTPAEHVLIAGPSSDVRKRVLESLHPRANCIEHTSGGAESARPFPKACWRRSYSGTRGKLSRGRCNRNPAEPKPHQGTLFLDEIGDMPLSLQPKLLRFLEQKELQGLGSSQVVHVDARVVAATNADLLRLVREGKFREDLYHYRLAAFPLAIPPLAERPGDIVQLAHSFLDKFSGAVADPAVSDEACALLKVQPWPGDVRERQNVIERALIVANGDAVIRTHTWARAPAPHDPIGPTACV